VTTIDVDTGIGLVLPPIPDDIEPPPIRERNILNILVDAQGRVLMDGELTAVVQVKDKIVRFVNNNGADPELSDSPDDAIVSIKTDRRTPYNIYIDMLDEVMGAYAELRNNESMARFGVSFDALNEESEQYEEIKNAFPKRISIAEPD